MGLNKPTDQEIKEFWKWCGFSIDGVGIYHCPNGIDEIRGLPRIDLNNLFKFAVPKLKPKTLMMETYEGGYDFCVLSEKKSGGLWNGNEKDPAIALFRAIQQVFKEV